MPEQKTPMPTILAVDDDADDQLLLSEAFKECGYAHRLVFVDDGDEFLDYVNRRDDYADRDAYPTPDLVLLDLNMPRLNGMDALEKLRSDERFNSLPVVITTTSWSEEDIARGYELGAASFIIKPVLYDELLEAIRRLCAYWFDLCELPPRFDG